MRTVFEYSSRFRDMVEALHQGKEELPGYEGWVTEHLGGPDSYLARLKTVLCPEIEYHCGDLAGKRVLDFGCGTGASTMALAEHFGGAEICGFDIDAEGVAICEQRLQEHGLEGKVRIFCADGLEAAQERLGRFDLALANAVLEHVPLSEPGL